MKNKLTESEINKIKVQYKPGTKIRLLEDMKEELYHPINAGEIGIVNHVDSMGTIHVNWENGSGLGLIPGVDKFEMVEKIKVIMVEVNKEPYVKEIYNTLKDQQNLVGGYIDRVSTFFSEQNSYDFVFNDEGKIIGLPLNRYIFEKKDAIAGNFMVMKVDEEKGEYITINDDEVNFLINKVKEECPPFNIVEYLINNKEEEEIER